MLKKAGIVVLGAAAGMGVFVPLANAGTAPDTASSGHEHSWGGGDHGHWGHGPSRDGGGDCGGKIAAKGGDSLVSLDNLASNLDLSDVNVLASQQKISGCEGGGGGGGGKAAVKQGDSLISADNALSNADVHDLNVLASQKKIG